MRKLKNADELSLYLGKVVEKGIAEIKKEFLQKSRWGTWSELTGWKAMRVVLVRCENKSIRLCARQNKAEGEVEIMLIRKPAILGGGLSAKEWDKAVCKTAAFLESKGFYPTRELFSDKTGDLFGDEA